MQSNNNESKDTAKDEKQQDSWFEGCEKRLILLFNGTGDLKSIPKPKWVVILKHASCAILNTMQNSKCIAHLLSESSLFIFKTKLMIKTCGLTTLLMILPVIIKECNKINLTINNIFYSRANFMFPENQPLLHRTFNHEVQYLNQYFQGNAIILGSLHKPRWHCYKNKSNNRTASSPSLEIVLFDLADECMKYYFQDFQVENDFNRNEHVIDGCCIPSTAMIDTYLFEPCGYSLNAILKENYWTIHVTPERQASFVSFETDYNYKNYKKVIQKVINLFKPKRFSFAINYYDTVDVSNWKFNGFNLSDHSQHRFSKYHNIQWSNYNKCGVGSRNVIMEIYTK